MSHIYLRKYMPMPTKRKAFYKFQNASEEENKENRN